MRGERGRDDRAQHIHVRENKGEMAEGRDRAAVCKRAFVVRHDTADAMKGCEGIRKKDNLEQEAEQRICARGEGNPADPGAGHKGFLRVRWRRRTENIRDSGQGARPH